MTDDTNKRKEQAYEEGLSYLQTLEADVRKEAWELKDCCTRYAFQGITILTAAYAIIGRLIFNVHHVGFVGGILCALCLVLISLITYKYGSANRVYGYLLHIQRSSALKSELTEEFSAMSPQSEYGWEPWMRFIGWEEALRAWRVVQPTIYFEIYNDPLSELRTSDVRRMQKTSILRRARYRVGKVIKALWYMITVKPWPMLRDRYATIGEYRWFIPKVLVATDAAYNSGNYLKRLCWILFFLGAVGYAFFAASVILRFSSSEQLWYDWIALIVTLLLSLSIFYYISARLNKKTDRLESELESIHSCAVLWQVSVICHYRALKYCRQFYGNEYYRYTFMVSVLVLHLIEFGVARAHEWIDNQSEEEFLELLKDTAKDIANDSDRETLLKGLKSL